MKWQRRLNIALSVVITIAFILLGAFTFRISYFRTFEALTAFIGSLKHYFRVLFGLKTDEIPSVVNKSEVLNWGILLPDDFESFKSNFITFWQTFFSKENFVNWLDNLGGKVGSVSKIIIIVLPCILVLILLIRMLYNKPNNKHNVDTVPLKIYKTITSKTIVPIKDFLKQYFEFVKEHKRLWISWIVLWVFNFNIASIIISFFAYYFYFAVSFDFGSLYTQFVKFFIDLQVIIKYVPLWIFIPLAWLIFDHWRKGIARNLLQHYEARNCGFINELPIVSMTCGSMGKKKTTLITDMALSQEVMFRQKAFELLQKNDMKFPNFPWISFEMELRKCMEYGVVYNLATIKEWVCLKRSRYDKHHNDELQLYGYDSGRYGLYYNDGLKTSDIFDVLSTYAQLYFIYVIQSSLIVSNYSVRTDNALADEGNFPLWATDFFSNTERTSRHAHILDFDVLRLGKKLIENNPNTGSFEFGVVIISEVGKERGNNLELKEVKKTKEETNQKNDLFNSWLKMCRHSATVDNFPFIKVFTDEQRPESWGADARDLCDIVNVASSSKQRLTLPFYTIEEMITEWLFNWFISLYYDFRFKRGDNTLLVYVLKKITSILYKRNARIYNTYGYCISGIEKEKGTMDGKIEKKKYFVMNKKIYARRFSTDCFSDYFNDLAKKTKVGLNDYVEYASEKATVDELKMQNSYFINALYKNAGSD